jgi:UDP-N-acetyl-D-glucosamine dehydrogenase
VTPKGRSMTPLAEKIADRSCRYGVVGLGYVGLPLAVAFAQRGVSVLGFEVDASKAAAIRGGRSYVGDVPAADVAAAVAAGKLDATTDFSRLAECDVISICVPTPLSKSRDPDVSYVAAATQSVVEALRPGQLIVLESTTYPGMTEEFCRPPIERGGLVVGRDVFLAFSPERVDPGNPRFGVRNTPKVVGGVEPESTRLAADFYRIAIDRVVEVSSAAAAEMAKLLENTFRSVNIALVNEVAIMCDRLGLDVNEVVSAAATKPFGFMAFRPGPGTGGHCIPLDPLYLSWKLRTLEYRARFVELADDVNLGMPRYVVERVAKALNDRRKSLRGSRVLVLGVSYKPDVDDTRESPSLEVIRHLVAGGAEVEYADPHVPSIVVGERTLRSASLEGGAIAGYDAIVVATNHKAFPWDRIAEQARLIVDARGAVPREKVRGTLLPLSGPALVTDGAGAPAPRAETPGPKAPKPRTLVPGAKKPASARSSTPRAPAKKP